MVKKDSKTGYSVIVTGTDTIKTIDVITGTIKRSLRLNGKITSSPVVVGDRTTVLVQTPGGKRKGYIFTLPGLNQTYSFDLA